MIIYDQQTRYFSSSGDIQTAPISFVGYPSTSAQLSCGELRSRICEGIRTGLYAGLIATNIGVTMADVALNAVDGFSPIEVAELAAQTSSMSATIGHLPTGQARQMTVVSNEPPSLEFRNWLVYKAPNERST